MENVDEEFFFLSAIMNEYFCYTCNYFFLTVETIAIMITRSAKRSQSLSDSYARNSYASLLAVAHHCERNKRAIAL